MEKFFKDKSKSTKTIIKLKKKDKNKKNMIHLNIFIVFEISK